MPHILGSDDLETCVTELFETDEDLHAKIEAKELTGDFLHKAVALEMELQAWTTETLKKVDGFQKRIDALNV